MLLAGVLLTVLVAGGCYLVLRDYRASRARATADTVLLARAAATNANRFLADRLDLLGVIAHAPIVRSGNRARLLAYLESLDPQTLGFDGGISFVDREGKIRVRTSYSLTAPPVDVSDRDYVHVVEATGHRYVSAAITSRILRKPVIPLAVPVRDPDGRSLGLIVGTFRLDQAVRSVRVLRFNSAEVAIIDRAGQLIVGSKPVTELAAAPARAAVLRSRSETSGVLGDATSLDGAPHRLIAFARATTGGWTVFIERPRNDAFGAAERALAIELAAIALAALIGTASALLLAGRVNRTHDQQLVLVAQERRARARAETDQEQARLLAETALRLDEPGELDERLRRVLEVYVPGVADHASIESTDESGVDRVLAAVGDLAGGVRRETGDEIVVPIADGSTSRARLRFVRDHPTGPFGDAERRLADDLAGRIALSLASARAFDEQRQIARSLQRSLLAGVYDAPRSDLTVAVRYEAAARSLEVGGDWYDAFTMPDGRIAAVVGDVVGHGLAAASAMGTLRSGMRALALTSSTPSNLLTQLDRFAEQIANAHFTTVACAIIDPEARTLAYSCAGHPHPLLVRPDGSACYLNGGRSLPLAGLRDRARNEASIPFEPGSILILYTDGLVERRGEMLDARMARLLEVAAGGGGGPLEELADTILAELLGDAPRLDDVALLALSLADERPRLHRRVPARSSSLASLRRELRAWLEEAGIEQRAVDDVVLAAGEACANAVLHAYDPAIEGDIVLEGRRTEVELRIVVHDSGHWRPRRAGEGGRGIAIMRAMVTNVHVEARPTGTTVSLSLELAPRPPG